ncbi:unnamed protein product, partial [Prorocentrum cordatum]
AASVKRPPRRAACGVSRKSPRPQPSMRRPVRARRARKVLRAPDAQQRGGTGREGRHEADAKQTKKKLPKTKSRHEGKNSPGNTLSRPLALRRRARPQQLHRTGRRPIPGGSGLPGGGAAAVAGAASSATEFFYLVVAKRPLGSLGLISGIVKTHSRCAMVLPSPPRFWNSAIVASNESHCMAAAESFPTACPPSARDRCLVVGERELAFTFLARVLFRLLHGEGGRVRGGQDETTPPLERGGGRRQRKRLRGRGRGGRGRV